MKRLLMAATAAITLLLGLATGASAHPLGNYTVNRAVAVTVEPGRVGILYLVDMAEIPAFNEIAAIDVDADGRRSDREAAEYAARACAADREGLRLTAGGEPMSIVRDGPPHVEFPNGAGGLQTLRLTCGFAASIPAAARQLTILDQNDDGHVGWHEVTIAAGDGVRVTASDAPTDSDSAFLTSYPADRLQTPPDIRQGSAEFELDAVAGASLQVPSPRTAATANDPLAALLGGELSPGVVLLGILLAVGLGAAHALSPGHGKTLVAAYLVGSRGTIRQAAGLGLTVAITHTAGVLVLGVVILAGGQLLLPERLIGWLTVVSGAVMVGLGAVLVVRALMRMRDRRQGIDAGPHGHPHPHAHPHPHPHSHPHPQSDVIADPSTAEPALNVRAVALLGMAGGMVPSASALIVLLAAVTTGRLAFGLALIGGFGLGMAVVLGGIAVATIVAHGWLSRTTTARMPAVLSRLGTLLPVGSGLVVAGFGLVLTLTAVGRLG